MATLVWRDLRQGRFAAPLTPPWVQAGVPGPVIPGLPAGSSLPARAWWPQDFRTRCPRRRERGPRWRPRWRPQWRPRAARVHPWLSLPREQGLQETPLSCSLGPGGLCSDLVSPSAEGHSVPSAESWPDAEPRRGWLSSLCPEWKGVQSCRGPSCQDSPDSGLRGLEPHQPSHVVGVMNMQSAPSARGQAPWGCAEQDTRYSRQGTLAAENQNALRVAWTQREKGRHGTSQSEGGGSSGLGDDSRCPCSLHVAPWPVKPCSLTPPTSRAPTPAPPATAVHAGSPGRIQVTSGQPAT